MLRSKFVLSSTVLALALAACDSATVATDTGVAVADSGTGTDSGLALDSGRRDAGTPPTDECAADDTNAVDTVGCNGGFVSGDGTPNETFGACMPGADMNPAGSCTDPNGVCLAATGSPSGECTVFCEQADTYVSTGTCPSGSRCFTFTDYALCFRDCDATHECRAGFRCDDEGSCVQQTPSDAGMPVDAGTPVDGGTATSDGGMAVDGGTATSDGGL